MLPPLISPPAHADSPSYVTSQTVDQPREEESCLCRWSVHPCPLEVASCCCCWSYQEKALCCCRQSVRLCPLICRRTSVAKSSTSQEKKRCVSAINHSTRARYFAVVRTSRTIIQQRDQVSRCRLWSLSPSLSLWCFCHGSVLLPSSRCPVNQVFKPNCRAKQSFVAIVFWLGKLLPIAHLPTGVEVLFSKNSTARNLCSLQCWYASVSAKDSCPSLSQIRDTLLCLVFFPGSLIWFWLNNWSSTSG